MGNDKKTCSGKMLLKFVGKSVFHQVNWDFGYRPTHDSNTYISFLQAVRLQKELSNYYKTEP